MRALAVLAVVAYHAGIGFVGGGYVGVDVFFVISGFLITQQLFRELELTGRLSFSRFYARRMIRLLPASSLVVVATVGSAWLWIKSPLLVKSVSVDALTAVGYGINVRLALQGTDYLSEDRDPSPLQHFWSLAVEEQFYFIWPAVLLVASAAWLRRGRPSRTWAAAALAAIAIGSLALCVWQTERAQPWAYFGIHARAWELAAGGLVALAANRLVRMHPLLAGALGWLGLAAIVTSITLYTEATLFPGVAAVLPVTGAVLVIAGGCAHRARAVRAVLGVAPVQWIGRLSYSWYLWHWPVLILAPHVAGHHLGAGVNMALALASLLPAWLSLRLVENPIRFRPVFRRRPRAGLQLGAALTCVTIGVGVVLVGMPLRVPTSGATTQTAEVLKATPAPQESVDQGPYLRQRLLELIQTSAEMKTVPADLSPPLARATSDHPRTGGCLAERPDTSTAKAFSIGCDKHGETGSATTVVLFGDSHAEQWFQAVNGVALIRHWRLVVLTKAGCTPAIAFTTNTASGRPYRECVTWREDALRRMAQLKPSIVFMTGRNYKEVPTDERGSPLPGSADSNWAKASLDTANRIRAFGAQPVFIQDSPDPDGVNVPNCIAAYPTAIGRCALKTQSAAFRAGRRAAIGTALTGAKFTVVDTTTWFCTPTICPTIIGNILVYRDGSHVTASYIKLLTPLLNTELDGLDGGR